MTTQNRTTLAVAFLLPCAVSLGMMAMSGTMGTSTYAMLAALLTATAAIGLMTWKNGQATGSVGQLLHETDLTPLTARAAPDTEATSASRWHSWQIRGDTVAETGRARALLGLSVALSGVLLYWMA